MRRRGSACTHRWCRVDEVTLAAAITGAFGLAGILVNVWGRRLEARVNERTELDVHAENELLRAGMRKHVIICPTPANDLVTLLRETAGQ
jgi:hypothetical protein